MMLSCARPGLQQQPSRKGDCSSRHRPSPVLDPNCCSAEFDVCTYLHPNHNPATQKRMPHNSGLQGRYGKLWVWLTHRSNSHSVTHRVHAVCRVTTFHTPTTASDTAVDMDRMGELQEVIQGCAETWTAVFIIAIARQFEVQ